ncbi:MAG: hypothetical protein WD095_00775, partial [Candidatus Paceibacterota bacterium]
MSNLNLEDILIDSSAEDDLMEVPLTEGVFKIFSGGLILILVIILFQLFNLAFFNHDLYEKTSASNFSKFEVQRSQRGLITDRFGEIIVSNEPSSKAFLSFNKMPRDEESRRETLISISELFNLDAETFVEEVKNHDWTTGRFLVENNINHDELISISSQEIPGLDIESSFKRIHHEPFVFSHIAGYTGLVSKQDISENSELFIEDSIGKLGLELYYDDHLRGINGKKMNIFNAKGEIQSSALVTESSKGKDLELFIDRDLQSFFYHRLEQQIESLGTNAGAVGIITNPKTGEVLSLVSVPSFENNNIVD